MVNVQFLDYAREEYGPILGPFPYVQFTYGILRDQKGNNLAASHQDGDWTELGDRQRWSDFIIFDEAGLKVGP